MKNTQIITVTRKKKKKMCVCENIEEKTSKDTNFNKSGQF